jgi:hypothetical protein
MQGKKPPPKKGVNGADSIDGPKPRKNFFVTRYNVQKIEQKDVLLAIFWKIYQLKFRISKL